MRMRSGNNKFIRIFSAEESSSLHVRRKRVVDKTRNGGIPIPLFRAPYIVNILQNGMSHCAGAILDADIIITTPYCFSEIPGIKYTILSNSALKNNGTPHRIIGRSSNPAFGFGNYFNEFAFSIKEKFMINSF